MVAGVAGAASANDAAPAAGDAGDDSAAKEVPRRISSFAVIDLETSNLPEYNFFKVGITELCIYGFSVAELEQRVPEQASTVTPVPTQPRVLHKLTLLFNPRMMIDPVAESLTHLSNDMLEHESPFDANAFQTLEGFLQHLPAPVCLVAHNGLRFDFPIVKHVLEKIERTLPSETLCVDSYLAFTAIDELLKGAAPSLAEVSVAPETEASDIIVILDDSEGVSEFDASTAVASAKTEEQHDIILIKDDDDDDDDDEDAATITTTPVLLSKSEAAPTDWRAVNEITPQKRHQTAPICQRVAAHGRHSVVARSPVTFETFEERKRKFRRSLFSASPLTGGTRGQKRLPPLGQYRLGNIYQRLFAQKPVQAHHAEADVDMLMKIMQYYGRDFLAYAEEHAIPFAEVAKLGTIRK